ncbi:MAG: hypothetical protein A3K66_02460 [Euryarchaeota archaeon RBG_16_67_27]|nr:MAG: hypothetical protein A3K66_02460 [Euryarchaeota archaeon RBG_16_67_27]
MQRARVPGSVEAVFAAVQKRLKEIGASTHLVDPLSITLLFGLDLEEREPTQTFFLAVVEADEGQCDIALARKRKGRRQDFHAMVVDAPDPIESQVLRMVTPR